jgi:hypothetical protein
MSVRKVHEVSGGHVEYISLSDHRTSIRYSDKFDDPNLPGEMQVTISLKNISCRTELNVIQQGVPGIVPPEACIWAGRTRLFSWHC